MALIDGEDIFDEIKEDFFARSFEAFRVQVMDRSRDEILRSGSEIGVPALPSPRKHGINTRRVQRSSALGFEHICLEHTAIAE